VFRVLCLGGSGVLSVFAKWVGFSHSAVGGCRGTLGLFELVSSSCSLSPLSPVLPLMLSPSPSSDSVWSRDISAMSPSGVFTLSVVSPANGSISGSCISVWARSGCAHVLDVAWRGAVLFGSSAFGMSGSPAALLLSCSARVAACATSFAVVMYQLPCLPPLRGSLGLAVPFEVGLGGVVCLFCPGGD